MATVEEVNAIKERLSSRLIADPNSGVSGIGVGQSADGEPELIVHLDGTRIGARRQVRRAAAGVRVRFVDQGPIRKQ